MSNAGYYECLGPGQTDSVKLPKAGNSIAQGVKRVRKEAVDAGMAAPVRNEEADEMKDDDSIFESSSSSESSSSPSRRRRREKKRGKKDKKNKKNKKDSREAQKVAKKKEEEKNAKAAESARLREEKKEADKQQKREADATKVAIKYLPMFSTVGTMFDTILTKACRNGRAA